MPVDWKRGLPPELWQFVLGHLSLMQLRLLKTVSRSMANHCRRVLRSPEWQAWKANEHAMEMEVATQAAQNYTLPLTVALFANDLCADCDRCFATIHRLKLKLFTKNDDDDDDGPPDSSKPSNWSYDHLEENGDYDIRVVDMLIDVHGRGLCGSEYALRRVLADAFEQRVSRGDGGHGPDERAQGMCDTWFEEAVDDDNNPVWGGGRVWRHKKHEWRFWRLLLEITPVTDVGGSYRWMAHRVTHQAQYGCERDDVDLLHLCANCPGLLT